MNALEKLARAVCAAYWDMPRATVWEDHHWQEKVPEVRAALEALLEPSEEMISAGSNEVLMDNHDHAKDDTEHAFRAMIQAALDGK